MLFAAPIHPMKRAISFGLTMAGLLFLLTGPAQAELDIVLSNAETEEPIYVLRNTETGKVLGTFWDRANETSDYGFESSVVPDFLWSSDRAFVAVMGGAPRSRGVSLYQVSATSLKPIPVPELTDEQARALLAIPDVSAEGTDAVRWEEDGTLLLHSWAQGRVTSDTEEPKTADVWAVLAITGDSSAIVSTSSTEPEGPAAEEESFDASRLAGVHQAIGRNPDGSSYKGTVKIEVTDGLVELEWKIAGAVSHGKGALVGMTLGVALDSGLALYRLVPQAEGQSRIGIWSTAGATPTATTRSSSPTPTSRKRNSQWRKATGTTSPCGKSRTAKSKEKPPSPAGRNSSRCVGRWEKRPRNARPWPWEQDWPCSRHPVCRCTKSTSTTKEMPRSWGLR
jgi:hypothetical protein